MEVESYAYGFETEVARPSGGYEFTCQHGPDECYGNKLLDCGLEHIEDHETFLNFSFCIMAAENPPSSGVECANQVSVSPDIIINCANSTEGENLLHDVGVSQSQLVPEVNYVPWIIINDRSVLILVSQDEGVHCSKPRAGSDKSKKIGLFNVPRRTTSRMRILKCKEKKKEEKKKEEGKGGEGFFNVICKF
ncbi:hypothetical protein Avbf_02820 [Armadillidium vulgare]|nr:hypothetical protein Avbf_02820 [Armadillidium vulgare]